MRVTIEMRRLEGTDRYFVARTVINGQSFVATGNTRTEAINNLRNEVSGEDDLQEAQ